METIITVAKDLTYDKAKLSLEIVTSGIYNWFTYKLTWLDLRDNVRAGFVYTSRVALDMNTLHSIAVKAHKLVYEADEIPAKLLARLFQTEEIRVMQSQNKPGE